MYCFHCANHIDEKSLKVVSNEVVETKEGATISYVCPRCGHLVHTHASEEEVKLLSQAAHAQVQRGKNTFARGMGMLSIGTIALIISVIFYLLARKPSNGFRLVTSCAEFYVFVILAVISIILLALGTFFTIRGGLNKSRNAALLKEINNRTFVQ